MSVYLDDGDVVLHHGDAAATLATLPAESVDCVVTSPPYFGLRDYGYDEQIGLEDTPAAFVARLTDVFREVRRVLAPHGTCWVNMGDSYAGSWGNQGRKAERGTRRPINGGMLTPVLDGRFPDKGSNTVKVTEGYKPKDLLGIPWRLAFALQDDGWWLRSDVIWSKPNPMPESVTDRPTKAHEYLFLLTKAPRYYWDAEAVRETTDPYSVKVPDGWDTSEGSHGPIHRNGREKGQQTGDIRSGRNVRSVWTFPTEPNPEAHFATFPRELVRRCLAAGCPERVCAECGAPSTRIVERESRYDHTTTRPTALADRNDLNGGATGHDIRHGVLVSATTVGWTDCGHGSYRPGVVLDPFIGSGTTAVVARAAGLRCVGIDGSAEYLEIAARRTQQLSLLGGAA